MNLKTVGRILAGILALFVLMNAALYIFNLDTMLANASLIAEDNWGRANIRANYGGPLIFLTIIYAFGLFANRPRFIHVGIFFFLSVIIGRVISLILDGYDPTNARGIVVAAVLLLINAAAYFLIERGEKSTSDSSG